MKNIPNYFTLLNLVLGCVAIILIMQTGEGIVNYNGEVWNVYIPEKVWWGSVCIGLAAVVDFLDGFVARLFKATSPLGAQLDSLADVVSFGVAPGMILYQLLRISHAYEPDGLDVALVWLLPALILPCAAAWRLAVFNLDPGQAYGFKGMPTPATGLLVASLPLILLHDKFGLQAILLNKWFLYALILVLSWLMVSKLPLMSLKFKTYGFKDNMPKWVLVGLVLIAALLLGWLAVPVAFIGYIALSLAFKKQAA